MRRRNDSFNLILLLLLFAGIYRLSGQIGAIPSLRGSDIGRSTATQSSAQATLTAWGPASQRTPSTPMPRPTRTPGARSGDAGAKGHAPYPAPFPVPNQTAIATPAAEARPSSAAGAPQATPVVQAGAFGKQLKRMAEDAYHRAEFGNAVAIDGNRAIVGAYLDGEQAESAGAAYIFERDDASSDWRQVAKLLLDDGEPMDWFGFAVDVEGDIAAVSDPVYGRRSSAYGSVYIYEREPGASGRWALVQRITTPHSGDPGWLGSAIALDGKRLAVGAPEYRRESLPGAMAGKSSSRVHLFESTADPDEPWSFVSTIEASDGRVGDRFGSALALQDGLLVIGAPGEDPQDAMGRPLDASGHHPEEVVRLHGGAVYVYALEAGRWVETAKIQALDGDVGDAFGASVAIDGELIVAGAPQVDEWGEDAGAVYVFEGRSPSGPWLQSRKLGSPFARGNSRFGDVVTVVDDMIAAAAGQERGRSQSRGAVYLYHRAPGGRHWIESARLTASDVGHSRSFGDALDFDGESVLVGVPFDGERAEDAGAVYFFSTDPDATVLPGP